MVRNAPTRQTQCPPPRNNTHLSERRNHIFNIVSIGAGEKGRLLLHRWNNKGGHETSDGMAHLVDAAVVLLDISDLDFDLTRLAPSLADKIVIDCSTPSSIDELRSRPSSVEEIARLCPTAHVVKALNVIDSTALEFAFGQTGPSNQGVYTSAYYCGDDAQAKQVVSGLLEEINLDPIDCGPLANATLLDSLGLLGRYLGKNVFRPPFAIVVVRGADERSPLDRWM